MKKMLLVSFAVRTLALVSLLTVPRLASAQSTRRFEPKQLQEDFQIARQALEESQSGLYRYTTKAELDQVFERAEKSLDHPMDFYEFYRLMMPTIAAIKCGHTTLDLPPQVREEIKGLPRLPFDVKVLDSKVYVFRDYAKGGTLAGREILSINSVPADDIISRMLAAASADGDIQTSRQREISTFFGEQLITLLGLRAPYEVVLASSGNNQTEKAQVVGLKHADIIKVAKTLYPQHRSSKKFADLKFLDDGRIAHLTYTEFGTNVNEGAQFMKRSFEAIQAKGSRALILDVRDNAGGDGELGKLLFSYLVGTPFRYYDDIIFNMWKGSFSFTAKYTEPHMDLVVPEEIAEPREDGKAHMTLAGEPLLGLQQPSKPTFDGRVYVLENGGSFSTTAALLSVLESHHRGVIIGQESGGGYYGSTSGSSTRIVLPNTRLMLYIPVVDVYLAVSGNHDAGRGVIPDYPVKHTIGDLITGVDKDFELALNLARENQ